MKGATASGATEDALITRILERIPHREPPHGPGDDAALIDTHDALSRVVTHDTMLEGVHFLRAHPPRWLGWKLLMVNLSDVAAMGATPEAFTLSAGLPGDCPLSFIDAFAAGVGEAARHAGVVVAGGDTVRSTGPVALGVTAWGRLPGPDPLRRTGGRPGDVLMVRGRVGRSAAGLAVWLESADPACWGTDPPPRASPALEAHLRPTPPLAAGPAALVAGAHAGMDVSDGLAVDAPRLARASDVDLHIELSALPADPACGSATAIDRALGGEDFGLLILAPKRAADRLADQDFVRIGVAEAAARPDAPEVIWSLDGEPVVLPDSAFAHFAPT